MKPHRRPATGRRPASSPPPPPPTPARRAPESHPPRTGAAPTPRSDRAANPPSTRSGRLVDPGATPIPRLDAEPPTRPATRLVPPPLRPDMTPVPRLDKDPPTRGASRLGSASGAGRDTASRARPGAADRNGTSKVQPATSKGRRPAGDKKPNNTPMIIAGVAGALALVVVLFIVLGKDDKPPAKTPAKNDPSTAPSSTGPTGAPKTYPPIESTKRKLEDANKFWKDAQAEQQVAQAAEDPNERSAHLKQARKLAQQANAVFEEILTADDRSMWDFVAQDQKKVSLFIKACAQEEHLDNDKDKKK